MTSVRSILITGASRGIGAALATGFAREGHRVTLNYSRAAEEAETLFAALVKEAGADRLLLQRADVGTRSEVQRMLDGAVAKFGQVDVLVNNAGLNLDGPFLDMTDARWDQVIATNLTGTFLCCQEFARRFRGTDGAIVNVSAATAIRGRRNGANYCSAKAGVIALTKCLALELAPRIRVNCVFPGTVETEEVVTRLGLRDPETRARRLADIPLDRFGRTEDVFRTVRYLVMDAPFVTGQNLFVNGGAYMG
jgi:3-oxoacyl-[acyl-carrier protein] reductase